LRFTKSADKLGVLEYVQCPKIVHCEVCCGRRCF